MLKPKCHPEFCMCCKIPNRVRNDVFFYYSISKKCHANLFTANAIHLFDVSSNMRSVIL